MDFSEHEMLRAMSGPCSLYRAMAIRARARPLFLNRNLSYHKAAQRGRHHSKRVRSRSRRLARTATDEGIQTVSSSQVARDKGKDKQHRRTVESIASALLAERNSPERWRRLRVGLLAKLEADPTCVSRSVTASFIKANAWTEQLDLDLTAPHLGLEPVEGLADLEVAVYDVRPDQEEHDESDVVVQVSSVRVPAEVYAHGHELSSLRLVLTVRTQHPGRAKRRRGSSGSAAVVTVCNCKCHMMLSHVCN